MDGSNTTSTLTLMPTAKDHDVELICLAFNPVLVVGNDSSIDINGTISSVETRRRLIVHCKMIIIFVGHHSCHNPFEIFKCGEVVN